MQRRVLKLRSRPIGSKRTRNTSPRVRQLRISSRRSYVPETATESEVWVNTRSGKYFKPGSRYYAKTKQGKFMTEIDALDSGYLPAGGTGR